MQKQFIYQLSEIEEVAKEIIPLLKHKVVLLNGQMGMGKTTLVTALIEALGISDKVSSPTFSLVNQYKNDQTTAYHFDFYRIENSEEALDFGVEEYFYSGDWCFLEWAERIEDLLPQQTSQIEIQFEGEDKRKISVFNSNTDL